MKTIYTEKIHEATRCINADTAVWVVSVARWRGAKNESSSLNTTQNMNKCTFTQPPECLNSAWHKAKKFRLRGVTASQRPS